MCRLLPIVAYAALAAAHTENGANLIVGCESGRLFFFDRNDLTTVSIDERIREQR